MIAHTTSLSSYKGGSDSASSHPTNPSTSIHVYTLYIHTYTLMHVHTHSLTHTLTHSHTHSLTHTHTQAHAQIYTHTTIITVYNSVRFSILYLRMRLLTAIMCYLIPDNPYLFCLIPIQHYGHSQVDILEPDVKAFPSFSRYRKKNLS